MTQTLTPVPNRTLAELHDDTIADPRSISVFHVVCLTAAFALLLVGWLLYLLYSVVPHAFSLVPWPWPH